MLKRLLPVLAIGLLLGADEKKDEVKKLQGVWQVVSTEQDGKKGPAKDLKKADLKLTITDSTFTYTGGGLLIIKGTFEIGADKKPKTLDVTAADAEGKEHKTLGIYEVNDDTLRVCFVPAGNDRPAKFEAREGTKPSLIVYKRIKK